MQRFLVFLLSLFAIHCVGAAEPAPEASKNHEKSRNLFNSSLQILQPRQRIFQGEQYLQVDEPLTCCDEEIVCPLPFESEDDANEALEEIVSELEEHSLPIKVIRLRDSFVCTMTIHPVTIQ